MLIVVRLVIIICGYLETAVITILYVPSCAAGALWEITKVKGQVVGEPCCE